MTVGLLLMSTLTENTSFWVLSGFAVLVGAGLGLSMQTIVIALQNSVDFADMGVATSSNTFFRSLGGAFGTAIFGTIFSNRVAYYLQDGLANLASTNPQALDGFDQSKLDQLTTNTSGIATLPSPIRETVLHGFVQTFHLVFLAAAPVTFIGFLLAFFLKEKPLQGSAAHHAARSEAAGEAVG
jgi:ABC-type sugar transport system permease subunit